jgi:hypothetical protein
MSKAFEQALKEIRQDHSLRKPLLEKIKQSRDNRLVISFFISFKSRTPLDSGDADMIEEVLMDSDCSNGVTLILNAPGGDGLAAERIIQVCKKYSGKDFETIVPSRAKSAATMVCLGSDRILMSPTSELGPIDPQIPLKIGDYFEWVGAHHIIRTFDNILEKAISLESGQHIEPLLQQLSQFNATQIETYRAATKLSESIAISSLKKGMLQNEREDEIRTRIQYFTNPDVTLDHGRALNIEHIKSCGLNIEELSLDSDLWHDVRDLFTRSIFVVDRGGEFGSKLLETIDNSYSAS